MYVLFNFSFDCIFLFVFFAVRKQYDIIKFMRAFFKLYLILFCSMLFNVGIAQDIEISGKVIDAESKERIPFANIALQEIYKGTASNALGEFSFKVDSLPLVLVITHLSFEPLEIEVVDNTP